MKKDDSYRVIRGGGWDNYRDAQVAFRFRSITSNRYDHLGFRLSRVVDPLEQLSVVLNEKG